MDVRKIIKLVPLFFILLISIISCHNKDQKKDAAVEPKKETKAAAEKKEAEVVAKRPPIINIADTLSTKSLVIYMKDSAASSERIGLKLGEIYGFKLAAVIKKNKLKPTGQPMAWYNKKKKAYFFEAGIPVDKKPAKLPSNVFIKQIGVDSVTIAHFHGPYDLLPEAYDVLNDYLKERKRRLIGTPYEVYVDDPMDKDGKMKDFYKVQTDVVYPWKNR